MKISFWKMPNGNQCTHGPQTWPWWRLFGLLFCRIAVNAPSFGYRMWIYTRRSAIHFDVYFDRRPKA